MGERSLGTPVTCYDSGLADHPRLDTVIYQTTPVKRYTVCPHCSTLIEDSLYIKHVQDCRENTKGTD
jgi:hypothetical protein